MTKYYVLSNSSSLDENVIKAETLISLAMAKKATINIDFGSFVCLFVLLLYVPSQQLWSLRDGQFT